MYRVLLKVFKRPRYSSVALLVALVTTGAALLLPNRLLLVSVLTSDSINVMSKVNFAFSLLGSISTNFTVVSASYLVLVSIMFGVNVALLIYYIRRRQTGKGAHSIGVANVGGLISAFFGIGCMACGSVILTAIFGIVGAGTLIAVLPLHGLEFGIVGIILLFISIRYIANRINDPLVCRID